MLDYSQWTVDKARVRAPVMASRAERVVTPRQSPSQIGGQSSSASQSANVRLTFLSSELRNDGAPQALATVCVRCRKVVHGVMGEGVGERAKNFGKPEAS